MEDAEAWVEEDLLGVARALGSSTAQSPALQMAPCRGAHGCFLLEAFITSVIGDPGAKPKNSHALPY